MPSSAPLISLLQDTEERCTECGVCLAGCAFLAQYGTPRSIAISFDIKSAQQRQMAYLCRLCGLCTAVCPQGVDPCSLFLAIRRYHVQSGFFDTRPYQALIRHEALGGSRLFSWYGLPDHCETVFFPGCALSGTRPAVTRQIYHELQKSVPSLGIILACCTKPSHDLGRVDHFQAAFGGLLQRLLARGVKTVLTACPSCTKIFREYGQGLSVQTVYEVLANKTGVAIGTAGRKGQIVVHDPCQLRDNAEVQLAVRSLLVDLGYTVVEMSSQGKMTQCCGEGGGVGCIESHCRSGWLPTRQQQGEGRRLVSSCAGCTTALGRLMPTVHILDLMLATESTSDKEIPVAKGLMTYINRLVLKLRLVSIRLISRLLAQTHRF